MPDKLRITHQYKQKVGLDVTVANSLTRSGWAGRFVAQTDR